MDYSEVKRRVVQQSGPRKRKARGAPVAYMDGAGARRIASAAKGCRAQVGELELAVGAMERDPGRFGLSPSAVAARQREVAELGAKCDRLLAEARGMVAEAEEVQRSAAAQPRAAHRWQTR